MKTSIRHFTNELERLCNSNVPISRAFDIMEFSAKSYWDVVVINVMRDSFHEMVLEEQGT